MPRRTPEPRRSARLVSKQNDARGGLTKAYAHSIGIHAGVETLEEAQRKGGWNNLSAETQSRRRSFCARMCGMQRKWPGDHPKMQASLRVWGCHCGAPQDVHASSNSRVPHAASQHVRLAAKEHEDPRLHKRVKTFLNSYPRAREGAGVRRRNSSLDKKTDKSQNPKNQVGALRNRRQRGAVASL